MDEALSSAARSLLRRLAGEEVFACHDVVDEDRLSLFRSRAGLSLGVGHARFQEGRELERRGLAVWSRQTPPRLTISAEGRAFLKRGDGGETAFADQHRDLVEIADADGSRSMNAAESPLMWLARRKGRDGKPLITAVAFAAGERLRADLTLAGALPRVTSNWTAAVAQGARAAGDRLTMTETALAARQRVDRALAAAGGEFAGLLVDVCGFLKGLETVEAERGWPPRSARLVLTMALDRLATHYGLSETTRGPERRPGRHVWQEADARPRDIGAV